MKQVDLYLISVSILGRLKVAFMDPITHIRFCPWFTWFLSILIYKKGRVFQLMIFGFAIGVNFQKIKRIEDEIKS